MYHSQTDSERQEKTTGLNSKIRLVFCMSALGMGIHMKSVNISVHFGPSFDLGSFMQETGRIGRDGSHAVSLHSHRMVKDTSPEMKEYLQNTNVCRRSLPLENFVDSSEIKQLDPAHKCCDVCAKTCPCSNCNETCTVRMWKNTWYIIQSRQDRRKKKGIREICGKQHMPLCGH